MEGNKTEVLCFGKHWDKCCILSNCEEYEARFHFQSGQQSKQDEIDGLQNRIDELKMANHNLSVMTAEAESYSDYWKYELDKLQKRIDRAVEHIEDYYGVVGLSMIVDILKGEETK